MVVVVATVEGNGGAGGDGGDAISLENITASITNGSGANIAGGRGRWIPIL